MAYRTHIIDPETKEIIPLYNDRIIELLSSKGYKLKEFKTYVDEKYNRNTLFTNDLISEYLFYLNPRCIKALLLIDKSASTLINDVFMWKKMFRKRKLPKYGEYTMKNYIKMRKICIKLNYSYDKLHIFEHQDLSKMPFINKCFGLNIDVSCRITIHKKNVKLYYGITCTECIIEKYIDVRRILFDLFYFNDKK